MNRKCTKCSELGLVFCATEISPSDYLEGNPLADIWIVGLNPSFAVGHIEERSKSDFLKFHPNDHSYFRDFKKVSPKLYSNWTSEKSNVAHTDLIKCFSPTFPPEVIPIGISKLRAKRKIIENCSTYLLDQICIGKPKLIICNGSPVCEEMIKLFPPKENSDPRLLTSYRAKIRIGMEDHYFSIVLSGFIGRIDDRNKRRLGKEIEELLESEDIIL